MDRGTIGESTPGQLPAIQNLACRRDSFRIGDQGRDLAAQGLECDTVRMFGLLAAATLLAAQPAAAPAPPADIPRRVISARTRIGGWRIEARTDVTIVAQFPVIDSASCEIKRSGLELTTWHDAGLGIHFGDNSMDPELGFESRQIRRIVLDDAAWDYREVDSPANAFQFENIAYRPLPPCYGCLLARSFTRDVRRRAGEPWVPPDLINNALLRARVLRIGYERLDENDRLVPPLLWTEIPLAGLGEAIAWCRAALASEGAHRLRGGLEVE